MELGSAVYSDECLNFHKSLDIITLKAGVNPIKTAVSHFILRANDLPRIKIENNLVFMLSFYRQLLISCPDNIREKTYNKFYFLS